MRFSADLMVVLCRSLWTAYPETVSRVVICSKEKRDLITTWFSGLRMGTLVDRFGVPGRLQARRFASRPGSAVEGNQSSGLMKIKLVQRSMQQRARHGVFRQSSLSSHHA